MCGIVQSSGLGISNSTHLKRLLDFPGGASGKEPACQYRRHQISRFDPWVGKIPWRRAWQPTLVFLTGESHGQRSLEGYNLQDSWRHELRLHCSQTWYNQDGELVGWGRVRPREVRGQSVGLRLTQGHMTLCFLALKTKCEERQGRRTHTQMKEREQV